MNNNELLKKILDLCIKQNNQATINLLNEYNLKLERLNSLKKLQLKYEPSKFLILKHKEWEKELEKLDIEINQIYKSIDHDLNEINKA